MKATFLATFLFVLSTPFAAHGRQEFVGKSHGEKAFEEFLEKPATDEIDPFETDECSNFYEGTFAHPKIWKYCCVEHDKAYWMGGTKAKKKKADEMLKSCVKETGHGGYTTMMKFGVRLFGGPYHLTSYRWGYGWPYAIGYNKLNPAQIESVNQRILQWEMQNLSSWVLYPKNAEILLPENQ